MRKWSLVCFLILFSTQAHALSITPSTGALLTGDQTSQHVIDTVIASTLAFAGAEELYKQDVDGPEVGSLAGSYQTFFSNTPSDPSDALIEYVGGPLVGSIAFLLVKDGKHSPAWYLFNLTDLGWNGTDDLVLSAFWPDKGAISHVTLYGTAVPEPATMLLLGFGLLALAGLGRRKFK